MAAKSTSTETAAAVAAAKTTADKRTIELALSAINKQFGDGSIMRLGDATRMQISTISTGSVAIDLVNDLVKEGAHVTAYDPKGMEKAREYKLIPESVTLSASPLEAVEGAEALILATEWKEFANQNFTEVKKRMHTPLVFDGRNLFNPDTMRELGFTYHGVGRGAVEI